MLRGHRGMQYSVLVWCQICMYAFVMLICLSGRKLTSQNQKSIIIRFQYYSEFKLQVSKEHFRVVLTLTSIKSINSCPTTYDPTNTNPL